MIPALINRYSAIKAINNIPNKAPVYEDARDVVDRAAVLTEMMTLSNAKAWINMVELLEAIKAACEKQNSCENCPFSEAYGDPERYCCSINDTPDRWQIDSTQDVEVLIEVTDFIR